MPVDVKALREALRRWSERESNYLFNFVEFFDAAAAAAVLDEIEALRAQVGELAMHAYIPPLQKGQRIRLTHKVIADRKTKTYADIGLEGTIKVGQLTALNSDGPTFDYAIKLDDGREIDADQWEFEVIEAAPDA